MLDMKRVAVVGCGAAGLVSAKYLRDAGFLVRVFEEADSVGGVWVYSDDTDDSLKKV